MMIALIAAAALTVEARVSFNDIAPIVWRRCTTCHRPGAIGPFSLATYEDVKRRATQIKIVTARRIMPPWKPEPGKGDFESERRLTDSELEQIQRWIADGAIEGDRKDLPPMPAQPAAEAWQLGTPDLVVRMPEAYTVAAGGTDVFRTFVLPIALPRARFVRALEFRPGTARVVHHANIGVDRTRSSRQLDLKDPEPGYVGGMVPDARYPEGQLLGWTPGQAAHPVPPGTAWRLEPGSDLVVQLHMQPTGKPEALQVSVGFYFTDEAPSRTPLGLRLGSETIDIRPGARDYVVADRYVLPVDADVLAVQPHAHNLARRMEAGAALPDGTTRWLIAMRYTYDNSDGNARNPHHPPARVVWGQNTSDEMGDLWIQIVARSAGDAAVLADDIRRKSHAEDLAAYVKLLREDPGNPLRHDAVGNLYLEDARYDDAIAEYRASLSLNADSAPTHYNLGFALSMRGRRDEAQGAFEQALRLDPEYAQAHNNLGAMLQLAGRAGEALDHFRRAVALRPDNVDAQINLAQLLSSQGRAREALDHFEAALTLRGDSAQALAGIAWIRATAADPSLRNSEQAVTFAERAAAATARRDLPVLDALAAAYASAGRFDDAVATVERGINLATAGGLDAAAAELRQRLILYQRRQPYRQSNFL